MEDMNVTEMVETQAVETTATETDKGAVVATTLTVAAIAGTSIALWEGGKRLVKWIASKLPKKAKAEVVDQPAETVEAEDAE